MLICGVVINLIAWTIYCQFKKQSNLITEFRGNFGKGLLERFDTRLEFTDEYPLLVFYVFLPSHCIDTQCVFLSKVLSQNFQMERLKIWVWANCVKQVNWKQQMLEKNIQLNQAMQKLPMRSQKYKKLNFKLLWTIYICNKTVKTLKPQFFYTNLPFQELVGSPWIPDVILAFNVAEFSCQFNVKFNSKPSSSS